MTVDGEILIPGIHNGNLFIGLQPPRAFEEKAEEMYHSTDLVCPHQYIAFYRYLTEVFDAHVVVHVGTHGTLEWLPGKEIGLSEECYPEVALGAVPHLYPYIIDVPGEGAQAKRRSNAVIIDHLIPSMTDSGLYGELTAIDDSIAQYNSAKLNNPQKLNDIAAQIWEQSEAQNLTVDLGICESEFYSDVECGIEKIHRWLSDIKSSKVKNGLHTFGQVPKGERYSDMLRLLVSIRNGTVPSLREGLTAAFGEDNERNDDIGRGIFAELAEANYDVNAIDTIIAKLSPPDSLRSSPPSERGAVADRGEHNTAKLRECLMFVANTLTAKLNATTDEITNFLRGVNGEFVPQGPSGAPSRGNAHILPTGRNFFMIDPTAVPSRAAWATGKRLADELLAKHRREENKLPESIAIVVYSGETIKTTGDDVAEIMYLYGVRPVWLESTDRVIGLEVIPQTELARPRIDVTLRISGLFRDTFPNLIERIEDAVNLVASLDEDYEVNYVRKHIDEDIKQFISEGMSREQAFDFASLRVFGCPPGTYGAGVDIMVNSKKWETQEDLGRAYINWSAHAYGRKIHGTKLQKVFERRMSSTDVTVKNISSYEADMLDSDDFYNYHGGLISAVKSQSGVTPVSYSTNAGDPENVQTRTVHEETSRIMRARIANPKWVDGLREHGYRGAQELSAMVDIVFGWDATADVVDNWMYDMISENYLFNDEIREWIEKVNPWALHAMSERLLEASQRGMWDASEDALNELKDIFLSAEGEIEGL
jgi:cobaltochelatase CobN